MNQSTLGAKDIQCCIMYMNQTQFVEWKQYWIVAYFFDWCLFVVTASPPDLPPRVPLAAKSTRQPLLENDAEDGHDRTLVMRKVSRLCLWLHAEHSSNNTTVGTSVGFCISLWQASLTLYTTGVSYMSLFCRNGVCFLLFLNTCSSQTEPPDRWLLFTVPSPSSPSTNALITYFRSTHLFHLFHATNAI